MRLANRDWERTFPPMSFELNKTGLLMLTAWLALGQAVSDEAKPELKTGTLIIEFDGLANDKGEVLVGLYNEAKKFPKENQALHNLKAKPAKKKCVIKAEKLPYGDYGVAAMHDENKSGNMDYNVIGLPTEKYGFSNNKRPGLFGPPGFKACRFVIDKPVVKIKITLK